MMDIQLGSGWLHKCQALFMPGPAEGSTGPFTHDPGPSDKWLLD